MNRIDRKDPTHANLGPVESLLFLEHDRVNLGGHSADVECMAGSRDDLKDAKILKSQYTLHIPRSRKQPRLVRSCRYWIVAKRDKRSSEEIVCAPLYRYPLTNTGNHRLDLYSEQVPQYGLQSQLGLLHGCMGHMGERVNCRSTTARASSQREQWSARLVISEARR